MHSTWYLVAAIVVMAIITFFTRYFSFGFLKNERFSGVVRYLGVYSPGMIILILAVYFFKDAVVFAPPYFLPELICIAAVAGLHLWKKNALLSIFIPTILYMFLVQSEVLTKLFT